MLSEDELKSLDIGAFWKYLLDASWLPVKENTRTLRSAKSGRVLRLPTDVNSHENLVTLGLAVNAVAKEEGLPVIEAFLDRLSAVEDFLFLGSAFRHDLPGQIPIGLAGPYYNGINNVIRKTIATQVEYKPAAADVKPRTADYLKGVTFGKVLEGSYIVTVHLPLASFTKEPIGRGTWERTIKCFQSLAAASERESAEPLLALGEDGWSAPMCEALGELIEKTKPLTLIAQASPNPTWKGTAPQPEQEARIEIRDKVTVAALGQASTILRGIREFEDAVVTGFAFNLENRELIQQGRQKVVRIRWEREDQAPVTVYVNFDDADYGRALDAHKAGRPVRVEGRLERRGIQLHLEPRGAVEILPKPSGHDHASA